MRLGYDEWFQKKRTNFRDRNWMLYELRESIRIDVARDNIEFAIFTLSCLLTLHFAEAIFTCLFSRHIVFENERVKRYNVLEDPIFRTDNNL